MDIKNFENRVGIKVPESIINIIMNDSLKEQMPLRLRMKNHSFLLELQYFLDITNLDNFDSSTNRIKFAVTTDGFELLVDLNTESLNILQDEFGDVDSLGVSFNDLVEAEKEPM